MDFSEILGFGVPLLVAIMVIASVAHATFTARRAVGEQPRLSFKIVIYCALHLLLAGGVYWHLISGGWLTEVYHWADPNNINLVLAIFEAACVAVVLVLLAARNRFFYKLVVDLLVVQFVIAAGVLVFLLIFLLAWKPRMI